MKFIIKKDYDEMSNLAAEIVKEVLQNKKNPVLGLATGSTPIGLYKALIKANQAGEIDFSDVVTFNLDEYLGISPEHPSSYHYFMYENFFNHIDINKENVHIPDGKIMDIKEFSKKYEADIAEAGGIDIQILGVGENGHIAFNEPGKSLSSVTFVENLTQETINVNSRFFDSVDQVPTKAVSMGVGTIMKAKKILLLANGSKKKKVIERLFASDEITTEFPVSFLKAHPDVIVIIDEEANPR